METSRFDSVSLRLVLCRSVDGEIDMEVSALVSNIISCKISRNRREHHSAAN